MNTSAKVLRERVQNILGQLSPQSEKENFEDFAPSPQMSTAHVTPVLRASSVKDIIAIVDGERNRRSVGSALSLSMRKLDEENEKLRTEIESLNLRFIESETNFSKRITDLSTKHARQLTSLQAELANSRSERESLLSEIEKLKSDNEDLTKNLAVKYKRDEDRFKSEVGRAKSAMTAGRKKWEEQKLAEIQQQTSRAVETEIQRLIAAHKVEISTLRNVHEQELKDLKETVELDLLRAQQKAEEVHVIANEKLEAERASHLTKEKECFDDFKRQLDEARRLFDKELAAERERSSRKEEQLRKECEEIKVNAKKSEDRLQEEFKESLNQQATKTQKELGELYDRADKLAQELERAKFDSSLLKQQLQISERDNEIYKESELAVLEDKIREVLDSKNREIDQLVAKVEVLERRREHK